MDYMENQETVWVVSYGSTSLDNRSEVICHNEASVESACNSIDDRLNPETIYVFTRPHTSDTNGYFWKGGHILVNGK